MKKPYSSLDERINKKATAANAEKVLKDYRHMKALAHRGNSLQSVRLSDMPSGTPDPHSNERIIIKALNATEFVDECDKALAAIKESQEHYIYEILFLLYFVTPATTAENIMLRMSMATTAYYHAKQFGLVTFAELFPDTWGELLEFNE